MSRGISVGWTPTTRRGFTLFWATLFALSLLLQYSGIAFASLSDSGTVNIVVPDDTQSASGNTSDGAIVSYIGDSASNQSSGTGIFDPFVRLQAGPPSEQGYNTNGTVEFDTKTGTWTHAIKVSAIPVVHVGGVDYYELFNDINETNSTPYISLNKVEVYFTSDPNLSGYSFGANATEEYAFSGTILIHDVNSGSGRGDLRYLVPLAGINIPSDCGYLNSACSTYFVLYSQWGTTGAYSDGNNYNSDGGFEEWKVKNYGGLQIVKNTVGGDGTFGFSVAGPSSFTTSITTSNGTGADATVAVDPGTYTISETSTPSSNWSLSGAVCSVNGGTPTTYTPGTSLTIGAADRVVCTFTNTKATPPGSLTLAKSLTGGPAGYTGPFTIHYACGSATSGDVSVSAGGSATISGIPAGTSCTVSETPPTAPTGYTFGTPTFSPSATVDVSSGQTVSVTTHNTLSANPGSLTLAKSLTGGPAGYTGPFTIHYACGSATSGDVSVSAGGSATISGIPAGTSCTVSETPPTAPTGYTFGTPTFSPSATVMVGAGGSATVTTTNTLNAVPAGLTLAKSLTGGPAGYTGPFTIHYACGSATSGDVSVSAGGSATISGIPAGTSCTVSETPPTAPTGYTFGTPTFSPSATVSLGAGASVTVTTNNTLSANPVPGISLLKQISTSASGPWVSGPITVAAGSNVYYQFTITNTSTTVTLNGLSVSDPTVSAVGCTFTSPLAPGASTSCVVGPVTAATTPGTYTNTATATGHYGEGTPIQSGPSSASYLVQPPIVCTNCGPTYALAITKGVSLTSGSGYVPSLTTTAGTTVYYRITVTNNSSVGLTGITLTDTKFSVASCSIPATLNAGASFSCDYSATAVEGTTVNTATASNALTGSVNASATVNAPAPSPTGSVAGVTSPPKPTLPPTDTLGRTGSSTPGSNFGLLLVLFAGLMTTLGLLTPVRVTNRRDRRG